MYPVLPCVGSDIVILLLFFLSSILFCKILHLPSTFLHYLLFLVLLAILTHPLTVLSHQPLQQDRMHAYPQGQSYMHESKDLYGPIKMCTYTRLNIYPSLGHNTLAYIHGHIPVHVELEWDSPLAGQCRVGHCRCESVPLCPAINRCHLTVQSARGRAAQPAGYQGRSLLSMEAANRISDQ